MFEYCSEQGAQIRNLQNGNADDVRFQRDSDIKKLESREMYAEVEVVLENTQTTVWYLNRDKSDQALLKHIFDKDLTGNTTDAAFRERTARRRLEVESEIINGRRIFSNSSVESKVATFPASLALVPDNLRVPAYQVYRRQAGAAVSAIPG